MIYNAIQGKGISSIDKKNIKGAKIYVRKGTLNDFYIVYTSGNAIARQAICYNVGYIYSLDWYEFYKTNNWRYREEFYEEIEFKETSAHEIGHEI